MTQEEYDYLLVESFYIRPDYKMWRICGFLNVDVVGLKRIPSPYRTTLTVSVFVCNYLPGIANVLFKRSKADISKIAKAVSKSPINTRRVSINKPMDIRVQKVRDAEIRDYQKIMKLAGEISATNDKCGGHEWHTVK